MNILTLKFKYSMGGSLYGKVVLPYKVVIIAMVMSGNTIWCT